MNDNRKIERPEDEPWYMRDCTGAAIALAERDRAIVERVWDLMLCAYFAGKPFRCITTNSLLAKLYGGNDD